MLWSAPCGKKLFRATSPSSSRSLFRPANQSRADNSAGARDPPRRCALTRSTSWRCTSDCAAVNCLDCVGKTSTSTARSSKSSDTPVGGALRLVPPKTDDSARTVPLLMPCLEALREHRKKQFAEHSDAWPDWEDHGLVFPSRRGTPMEP